MRPTGFGVAAALLLAFACGAALPGEAADSPMTSYRLALLRGVPDAPRLGERETVRLQEGHVAFLERLRRGGQLVVAGALAGSRDVREVVVLVADSEDEAAELLRDNPWVAAGRWTFELHTWWAAGNILQRPENLRHMERCHLGLLQRPADAPAYDDDRLREIQAGHMANLEAMAASGDLVIAGPIQGDGALRGILVFRTPDAERIRELVARDPAVRAGRLGLQLYPWHVPAGTLPPR